MTKQTLRQIDDNLYEAEIPEGLITLTEDDIYKLWNEIKIDTDLDKDGKTMFVCE